MARYVQDGYIQAGYVTPEDLVLTAGVGTLTLTGQAPTVQVTGVANVNITAGAGSLALGGQAPSLELGWISPVGAGALALSGQAPAVDVTIVIHSAVTAGAGAIALTGQQAALEAGAILAAGAGAVALAGQAPTVQVTGAANVNVTAGLGTITLAGQAVSVIAEAPTGGAISLYNTAKMYLFDGTLDLDTDAIAVVLLGPGYTPSATHDTWSDISGQEASGYTQQALSSKALAISNDTVAWDGADVTFGPSITTAAKYVALVQGIAGSLGAGDKLIGWSQLRADGTTATVLNSSLDVHWSGAGIWRAL